MSKLTGYEALLSARQNGNLHEVCSGTYWEAYNKLQLEVMQGRMKQEDVTEERIIRLAKKILSSSSHNNELEEDNNKSSGLEC